MKKNELIKLIEEYLFKYPNDQFGLEVMGFLNSNTEFWQRSNLEGHITASAWVINQERTKALMTHHKKLNIWVQLGGHIEKEDNSIYEACERELKEESGLINFQLVNYEIFDLDIHQIPESKTGIEAHDHLDFRLLFQGNDSEIPKTNLAESNLVQWMSFEEIRKNTSEQSVLRMIEKTLKLKS